MGNANRTWRCSLRTFRCCWNSGPYKAVLQIPRSTWGYDYKEIKIVFLFYDRNNKNCIIYQEIYLIFVQFIKELKWKNFSFYGKISLTKENCHVIVLAIKTVIIIVF